MPTACACLLPCSAPPHPPPSDPPLPCPTWQAEALQAQVDSLAAEKAAAFDARVQAESRLSALEAELAGACAEMEEAKRTGTPKVPRCLWVESLPHDWAVWACAGMAGSVPPPTAALPAPLLPRARQPRRSPAWRCSA